MANIFLLETSVEAVEVNVARLGFNITTKNFLTSVMQKGQNGRYGRISHFRDWIDREMSDPVFCGGTANAEEKTKKQRQHF